MSTGFDSSLHGFAFVNRFSGGAVLDEMAAQDRLDEVAGFDLPGVVGDLLRLARSAPFWGPFGLCGGMAFASLDNFHTGTPPPTDTAPPAPGTGLFAKLVARQVDSLDGQRVMLKCLEWQVLPDRPPWWWPWLRTAGSDTTRVEWPRLRASLDAGRPEALCLLRARGLVSPGNNHQVVASGYEMNGPDDVVIQIYDPNHPGETPEIRMRLGPRWEALQISQSTGESLRGFFVQNWSPKA
ncbi:MAG: hypothetical protein R3258_02955 [Acidimicrobiia bacterium]|nr:hypothetical protein [Acidimicrobiia bacterium]